MKIRVKSLLVTLLVAVLPFSLISVSFYISMKRILTNQVINQLESIASIQENRIVSIINNNLESIESYAGLKREILEVTETNAVIFLDYWDKAIFPERKVGLVRELPEENRYETLSDIVTKLSQRRVPVYFLIENSFKQLITHEALSEELSAREYTLLETEVQNLYKLQTEEP